MPARPSVPKNVCVATASLVSSCDFVFEEGEVRNLAGNGRLCGALSRVTRANGERIAKASRLFLQSGRPTLAQGEIHVAFIHPSLQNRQSQFEAADGSGILRRSQAF